MAIVNCTPDSFSGDGCGADVDAAVRRARAQLDAGADLIDVGALSTRPGADPADADTEIARLVPVVEALRAVTDAPISIDTYRVDVARAALDAGADFINDVAALADGWSGEPRPDGDGRAAMAVVCARADAHLALMHAAGSPDAGWPGAEYPDGVVDAAARFLRDRLALARAAGVPASRLWIDPGFGFGKTDADHRRLFAALPRFRTAAALEGPDDPEDGRLLVGLSRKRWIGAMTGLPVAARDPASVVMAVLAAERGADMVRVHDAAGTRAALEVRAAALAAPER